MRLPSAIVAACAYALGRDTAQTASAAPIVIPPQAVVEPWRPAAMTDDPDPIAEFVADALKTAAGARTPAPLVLAAYETWALRRGHRPAERDAVLARLHHYGSVLDIPKLGPCLIGVALQPWATRILGHGADAASIPATSLRAIPGLRNRILADAALFSAELLAVLQATRSVLEPATDEPGPIGDVVRAAAGILDDALADAACPSL